VRRRGWVLALVLVFVAVRGALAHEVRPAFLQISEGEPGVFSVLWKQPTLGDVAIHLEPRLSNGWLERPPSDQYAAAGFLIRSWTIRDPAARPLAGRTLTIEGLKDTITDVVVQIRLRGGLSLDAVLRPETPAITLDLGRSAPASALGFVELGIGHILTGPDHLLFVLGLLLIVRDRWSLLKTITAFTLAHSLTLALAVLGMPTPPAPLLNALIALSILCLACEVLRARQGAPSLASRRPWAIAFSFGLLHGLGFAGGLKALGLEGGALLLALVLFNLGVEVGQGLFVALCLALKRAVRLMEVRLSPAAALAPTYLIGGLGAYWTLLYSLDMVRGGP
jgi:hypothetical protein